MVRSGQVRTGLDAVAWAREVADRGAGEILLTSMDCDGTCDGFDLDLTAAVADAVSIPVIASGGAGAPEHFGAAVRAGAAAVPYTLQLFDDRNLLVVEIEGSLDIPPVQTVPVVVPNINVGTRTVSRTLFTFTEEPAWRKTGPLPVLRIQNQRLSADGSRLSAAVYNDSNSEARDAVAAAVLFDSQGIARAASLSRIQSIARKAAQEVVFTWSGGVPDIVRAEITVLPPL